MKNILITGGLGFVGGRLTKKLSEKFSVLISSRKKITREILDIHGAADCVQYQQLLSKETFPDNVDVVIHLAALNEWDCVKYPSDAIKVNIDDTRIILENCIAKGVQQFIYFSTAHVYSSPLKGLITEKKLPIPVHPYAITHKAAEDYVIAAKLQNKIHSVVVRLSNSFGAPIIPTVNRWTLLANDLCKQAIEKKQLSLLSNGCQYRDFVCLSDVENCIHQILSSDSGKFDKLVYNLGSGIGLKVIDLATMIVDIYSELLGEIIPLELPDNSIPTEEPSLHFSIQRLLNEGVVIKNDFKKELTELLLFCNKNFNKID